MHYVCFLAGLIVGIHYKSRNIEFVTQVWKKMMDFYDSVLQNHHFRPNYEFFDISSGIYIIYDESAYVLLKNNK